MKKWLFLFFTTFNITTYAEPMQLAITVDDLPVHMNLPPNTTRLDVAKKMLAALQKHSLKQVYGFVNAGNIHNDPQLYGVLTEWLAAGQLLGNHTYNHVNFNTYNAKQFIDQIAKNNDELSQITQDDLYFRYPYLYEGDTQAKRDEVRSYLTAHHYQIAQVTVDFEDYLWNNAYVRCVAKNDTQSIAWLKKSYIEYALKAANVSQRQSELLFQRNIKQILLLHIGVFDALMLDDLLTAYEKAHIKFITLKEALGDKAYKINPNVVGKNTGNFISQVIISRKGTVNNIIHEFNQSIPLSKLKKICNYEIKQKIGQIN